MTQITLEIPDDVALTLEALARHQKKTVAEVAAERLATLEPPKGSPAAALHAMRQGPLLTAEEAAAMEAAIAEGRSSRSDRGVFDE
jgi:hypothetical protein